MKNFAIVFFMAAVLLALSPASARAQEYGFYLTPKVSYNHIKSDVKKGGNYSYSDNVGGAAIAAGYDFNVHCYAPVRLELELAMRAKTSHSKILENGLWGRESLGSKTGATSIFANVYFDFHNESDFIPYIGGGVGAAYLKLENRWKNYGATPGTERFNSSGWDFAWNAGAGLAYKLNEQVALDLGYRYTDLGTLSEVRDFNKSDLDGSGHEVLLGVRFTL